MPHHARLFVRYRKNELYEMSIVHEADGATRTVATTVETADSWLAKGIGLMFRRSIPSEYALVFPFDRTAIRGVHMLCVPFPIDVVWLSEERVEQVRTLAAWTGRGAARADTVLELPAGAAAPIAVGDRIAVEP